MRGEKELHFRGIDIRSLASFGAAKKGGIAEQVSNLKGGFAEQVRSLRGGVAEQVSSAK